MIDYEPFEELNITNEEWDRFVEDSDNGTIFHRKLFLSYHPEDRFKDASLIVKKNNELLAVFPAVIVEQEGKKILSSHNGASFGGFVYKSNLNFKEAFSITQCVINFAKELDCDKIQLTLPPIIYQSKY